MVRSDRNEDVDLRKETFFQELLVLVRQDRVSFLIHDEVVVSEAHVCYRLPHPTV